MVQQQLEMMEFGVTGLAQVLTLVTRWPQVLAGLATIGRLGVHSLQ